MFLSGLWRSGSTYVWSRFRADPSTYAYYEPLHHGLAKLTAVRIPRDDFHKTASMHHPALAKPYYEEFRPLLRPVVCGVRKYSEDLAYRHWVLDPDEAHPRLGRYIDSLIDHAHAEGRQPVLGCVRVTTRLGWLGRRRPDACLIHLDRAPLDVWRSCMAQAREGNFTFFSDWLNVIRLNAGHRLIAPLAARLAWRTGLGEALRKPKHRHHDMLQTMAPEETYFLIAYLWAAAALHGLTHSHAVIDVNRSAEPGYNAALGQRLRDLTGAAVSFGDMRIVSEPIAVEPHGREALEHEAMALLRRQAGPALFDPARVAARLDELAPAKAELLARVLDAGLHRHPATHDAAPFAAAARTML